MTSAAETKTDHRLLRGQETRRTLMRAAEKLIGDKGLEQVKIREILNEAQQNNASALQYHFGNLKGLIAAIHAERSEQLRTQRARAMDALMAKVPEPNLHQLCAMIIHPGFELARTRPDFRNYLRAFGLQLVVVETSAASAAFRKGGGGGPSGIELGRLLREALPHLSEKAFRQRMDFAVRLCASAMYNQARGPKAFQGEQAEFFVSGLVDALVGLLSAEESR